MPRNLDDDQGIVLVPAPTPVGSVTPQQLAQFLNENPRLSRYGVLRSSLNNVPADRWDRISTFVHDNLRDIGDFGHFGHFGDIGDSFVEILTRMPIERLDTVLAFVRKHKIMDLSVIHALSKVVATELEAFITFIQDNHIIQQSKLLWILVQMSKDKWLAFTSFIRRKNFNNDGMNGGLLYAKYHEDRWDELFIFVQKRFNINFVTDKLEKMDLEQLFSFITFLKEHDITDSDSITTFTTLAECSEAQRKRLWPFAKQHNLIQCISSLKKISDAQWEAVASFIIEHHNPPSKNTIFSNTSMIDALSQMQPAQLLEFESFIRIHQITDNELIVFFATTPMNMRDNLFTYLQEYNPKLSQLYYFKKIPADLWPQFMRIIKVHHITRPDVIFSLAYNDSELWEDLAIFIEKQSISEDLLVIELTRAPIYRTRALMNFVDEFNINDQYVMTGLLQISAVQQWAHLINLSTQFFHAPLRPEDRARIMITIYNITGREIRRNGRIMPIYNEGERQGRITNALAEIQAGRMPEDPREYCTRLCQILTTPLYQLGNMFRAEQAGAVGINVHADGRDDATTMAMSIFMKLPYDLKDAPSDYQAFINYLNTFPDDFVKKCAQRVLGLRFANGFGPMSADVKISSYGLNITGREFFARLWHFINHGSFIGMVDGDALNRDRENARVALVRNLADAYEEDDVVCNPGKIQRIVVGVLQGRVQDIQVDKEIPVGPVTPSQTTESDSLSPQKEEAVIRNAVAASLRDFLKTFESAKTQQELKVHVEGWLQKEYGLKEQPLETYRNRFIGDLEEYLKHSDLPENAPASAASSTEVVTAPIPTAFAAVPGTLFNQQPVTGSVSSEQPANAATL